MLESEIKSGSSWVIVWSKAPLPAKNSVSTGRRTPPPHYANHVRAFLDDTSSDPWIGRGGPTSWPPRSPDMTPLDFFLCGFVKDEVYCISVADIAELHGRIYEAIGLVIPEMLSRVWQEIEYRLDIAWATNGAHIERLAKDVIRHSEIIHDDGGDDDDDDDEEEEEEKEEEYEEEEEEEKEEDDDDLAKKKKKLKGGEFPSFINKMALHPTMVLLFEQFPGHWIGQHGPLEWPARSPDLTSLIFFFWGYIKNLVYEEKIENVEHLKNRIIEACAKCPSAFQLRIQRQGIARNGGDGSRKIRRREANGEEEEEEEDEKEEEEEFFCLACRGNIFMEAQAKKDPNSVASFIHNCLLKKLHDQSQVKNIVLFSGSCGGQNENMVIVFFCMWFAKVFHVDIRHIFPVHGHSFSQCDRNFGLIKRKTRNLETVTTAKPYLEALTSFFLKYSVTKGSVFRIQKYVQLKCKSNGSVLCSPDCTEIFTSFNIWKQRKYADISALKDITPRNVPNSPLNPQKENDVRALSKYMDTESCCWLDNIIEESKVGLGGHINQDDSQNELDRRLRSREMQPTSTVQLSAMLQEEWRVDILYKLVESMPDRLAAVIATRGGTTRS
ncbi:hypothetical protein ANN_06530 [Periplaneta americana]|uniref:Uncharacterized protein n=1 Tax=Periplaneta americana TaxID=6978 RepID=A0ABQ8TDT6_PERAM|nr:hypothetical protein ANN_06530 [Periplaneta americana]